MPETDRFHFADPKRAPIVLGVVETFGGKLKPGRSGLHASANILDALPFAKHPTLCWVRLGGEIVDDGRQFAAREREVLRAVDVDQAFRAVIDDALRDQLEGPLLESAEAHRNAAESARKQAVEVLDQIRDAEWALKEGPSDERHRAEAEGKLAGAEVRLREVRAHALAHEAAAHMFERRCPFAKTIDSLLQAARERWGEDGAARLRDRLETRLRRAATDAPKFVEPPPVPAPMSSREAHESRNDAETWQEDREMRVLGALVSSGAQMSYATEPEAFKPPATFKPIELPPAPRLRADCPLPSDDPIGAVARALEKQSLAAVGVGVAFLPLYELSFAHETASLLPFVLRRWDRGRVVPVPFDDDVAKLVSIVSVHSNDEELRTGDVRFELDPRLEPHRSLELEHAVLTAAMNVHWLEDTEARVVTEPRVALRCVLAGERHVVSAGSVSRSGGEVFAIHLSADVVDELQPKVFRAYPGASFIFVVGDAYLADYELRLAGPDGEPKPAGRALTELHEACGFHAWYRNPCHSWARCLLERPRLEPRRPFHDPPSDDPLFGNARCIECERRYQLAPTTDLAGVRCSTCGGTGLEPIGELAHAPPSDFRFARCSECNAPFATSADHRDAACPTCGFAMLPFLT